MKLYDMECPVCGMLNRNLYLDETEGWMECEHCGSITKSTDFPENVEEVYVSLKHHAANMRKACIHRRSVAL